MSMDINLEDIVSVQLAARMAINFHQSTTLDLKESSQSVSTLIDGC